MFYSIDLLRIRGAKKGRLPKCWIAATMKEFVGHGLPKLTKKAVISFETSEACNDILEKITEGDEKNRLSLYLSSQLMYGTIKMFQKQIQFLYDDCYDLMIETTTQPKLKLRKDVNVNIEDFSNEQQFDPNQLFPPKKDKYLIQEFDRNAMSTEITFEFDERIDTCDPNEIRCVRWDFPVLDGEEAYQGLQRLAEPELHNVTSEHVPEVRENEVVVSESIENYSMHNIALEPESNVRESQAVVTGRIGNYSDEYDRYEIASPKRRSRIPHNETPSKRKRSNYEKSLTDSQTTPKSMSRLRNMSEMAQSPAPAARRSIFKDFEPEIASEVPIQPEFEDVISPAVRPQVFEAYQPNEVDESMTAVINLPQIFPGEPIQVEVEKSIEPEINLYEIPPGINEARAVVNPASFTRDSEEFSQSMLTKTIFPPPPIVEVSEPAAIQEDQSPPVEIANNETQLAQKLTKSNDQLELDTLEGSTPPKRRKRKQKFWFDEVKQVSITYPSPADLYTKTLESARIQFDKKIPGKELLKIPATLNLGPRAFFSSNSRKWSKMPYDTFFEMILTPCENSQDLREQSLPRDFHVDKSSRRSRIGLESTSEKSVSDKSLLRLTTSTARDKSGNTTSEAQTSISSPRVPPPEIIDEPQVIVSPQQAQENFEITAPQNYPENENNFYEPQNQPIIETAINSDGTLNPKQTGVVLNTSRSETQSSSGSESIHVPQNKFLLTTKEFYDFLERLWEISMNYSEPGEGIKIEFGDILSYEDNSIQEVYHYTKYLSVLQRNRSLYLEQERPFGTIFIIKSDDN